MKKFALLLPLVALLASCEKKKEEPETETTESNVHYTISVGSFANASTAGKSAGIQDANVFITAEDGSIVQRTTDVSGMVHATVPSGIVAVTIKASGFTDLTYTADLRSELDSSKHYNIGSSRSAATLALLYTLNEGTSTVSGKAQGDYDTSRVGLEDVPDGVKFRAYLRPSISGVNHNGAGHILTAVYTAAPFEKAYALGKYSMNLPGSSDGVEFSIEGDDFSSALAGGIRSYGAPAETFISKSGKESRVNFTYVLKP